MQTVRWGILGTGWIAGAFAEGLHHAPGAALAAVASRRAEAAQRFATTYGAGRAHDRYESLVQDPDVDVVYVATPNALHREHALMAIAAGKAVLCEKPFALDAAEAREIVTAARAAGVFCMEAMWTRCAPAFQRARACVQDGEIGTPLHLQAQLGFPKQRTPGSRLFEGPGAGALLDFGVYPLALAQALLGRPAQVQAQRVCTESGVDEHVSILLGYASGATASLTASLSTQLSNDASLHGRNGVLHLQAPLYFPERFSLRAVPPSGETPPVLPSATRRLKQHPLLRPTWDRLRTLRDRLRTREQQVYPAGTGYTVEALEVMRCLRSGERESPLVPLDDSLAVMETVDRIRAGWSA